MHHAGSLPRLAFSLRCLALVCGLGLVCLSQLALFAANPATKPTFRDVWQVWLTTNGKTQFYSETPNKAEAQKTATAFSQFPEGKLKGEVRGPFKRPVNKATDQSKLFAIILQRKTTKDNLVTGDISVNGISLGNFYENDKVKIKAGTYTAHIRLNSAKHVQGPGGLLGTTGDFLIELDHVPANTDGGPERSGIEMHVGTKPEHSEGCILLGPVQIQNGKRYASPVLKQLRLLFFDGEDNPKASPNKVITVEFQDAAQTATTGKLAWGNKVSAAFRDKVRAIAKDLQMNPDYLMAVMAFESGETFSPSIRNAAGSGAVGLIQFMPSTAGGLGTTTAKLAAMTAEEQLTYVEKYLSPYKGRMQTVEDAYMAVLYPAAVGKPNDHVLFSKPSIAYKQNAGLDANKDGKITKAEAAAHVRDKLTKGQQPGYIEK